MKRQLIAVLAAFAVMALLFTSCGKKEAKAPAAPAQGGAAVSAAKPKVGFVYIGSITDNYTGAHDVGRKKLEQLGYQCAYMENVPENAADCEAAIRSLIDQGCNVVYTNSFGFMDPTLKVAEEFPNVKFGHCSGYKQAANMSSYFGKGYQTRYLSGIAAGYKTKSNKIGYVAAFPIPEVIRGINAFTLGVQSVNPQATVDVVWSNTWLDAALEKQAAIELLNRGCDVIAQHQDTTAPQVAAQEKGAFAIGYDYPTPDAAPKAYLTAPLFHWDVFYIDDVKRLEAGTWTSRAYWGSLAEGTVSLDTLTANNDPRAAPKIAEMEAKIKSGEFEPFTGPLTDQSGTVKVAAGTKMTDDEIWNMGWFIKGVIGTIAQ